MSIYQIGLYFNLTAECSVILPAFYYLSKKENLANKTLNILGTVLILGGFTDLVNNLMSFVWGLPNVQVANVEFILEFILISWLFAILCPQLKKRVLLIIPLFI